MHVREGHPQRQAALALHALSPDDRERVWSRLDESKRTVLTPLLDELSSLGIPKGRTWIEDERSNPDADGTRSDQDDSAANRRIVWRLHANDALSLLTRQSIETAVIVMQLAPWPWLAEVVENWPPQQRHTLRARLEKQDVQLPAKLSSQLLKQMGLAAVQHARAQSAGTTVVKRPWYHAVMSLFMLT